MAVKDLLLKSDVDALRLWLGFRALPPGAPNEFVRWKGPPGEPMRIVFHNRGAFASVGIYAVPDVKKFLASSFSAKNSGEIQTKLDLENEKAPSDCSKLRLQVVYALGRVALMLSQMSDEDLEELDRKSSIEKNGI